MSRYTALAAGLALAAITLGAVALAVDIDGSHLMMKRLIEEAYLQQTVSAGVTMPPWHCVIGGGAGHSGSSWRQTGSAVAIGNSCSKTWE